MKAELKKLGVPFPEDAKAPELRQLLREHATGTTPPAVTPPAGPAAPVEPGVITPEEQAALDAARAEGKAQAEAEAHQKVDDQRAALDKEIKDLRAKKSKEPDEKEKLRRLMSERARLNNEFTRDLEHLFPSQMTKEEMEAYCKTHEIECKKGDSTFMLRARIKAFRNPGYAEKLAMLESAHLAGRIVR